MLSNTALISMLAASTSLISTSVAAPVKAARDTPSCPTGIQYVDYEATSGFKGVLPAQTLINTDRASIGRAARQALVTGTFARLDLPAAPPIPLSAIPNQPFPLLVPSAHLSMLPPTPENVQQEKFCTAVQLDLEAAVQTGLFAIPGQSLRSLHPLQHPSTQMSTLRVPGTSQSVKPTTTV